MTWLRFKSLTLRLNLFVVIGGWLAFWGYGVFVDDIPPWNLVPTLLALSVITVVTLTSVLFLACHTYVSVKQAGKTGASLSKTTRLALLGLVIAITCSTLASGGINFAALIEESLFILSLGLGLPSLLWLIYGFPVEIAPRFFNWKFD